MVYLLLANGFEEVEALTPVDLLRRAGKEVCLVGVGGNEIQGARGVTVLADVSEAECDLSDMEMLILPGGYPGYVHLGKSPFVEKAVKLAAEQNVWIGAICAAPTLLGKYGFLKGKPATCYPGMENGLVGALVSSEAVCVADKIITSRSAATALLFALTLVEKLCGLSAREKLEKEIAL